MFERDPMFVIMVLLLLSGLGFLLAVGFTLLLAYLFPGNSKYSRVRNPNQERD